MYGETTRKSVGEVVMAPSYSALYGCGSINEVNESSLKVSVDPATREGSIEFEFVFVIANEVQSLMGSGCTSISYAVFTINMYLIILSP